jgi:1-aminocyclopropane-1-carboxylate deaminase/D-cysteine desulfhydrase-like pyridoxal-dependent ACC family enzyme
VHFPLVARFPALASVRRVSLGQFPTPVENATAVAPGLWIKRDDRTATPIGGNKVRALELLLGAVPAGARIVTVGGAGSTHALATAFYGRRSGFKTDVALWNQEMNDTARDVAQQIPLHADAVRSFRTPVGAFAWALWRRTCGAHWIPPGGTSPLGILGSVNAALELAEQIERGEVPRPARIVVALGTGGTAAGLVLGLRIAGLDTPVIGARVVPRLVARAGRVIRLANATARLIERRAGVPVPRVPAGAIRIVHDVYAGAYGRELAGTRALTERLAAATGIRLDATYTAKACAAAIAACDGAPTLFWMTFGSVALGEVR